jgi:hypothetical protein
MYSHLEQAETGRETRSKGVSAALGPERGMLAQSRIEYLTGNLIRPIEIQRFPYWSFGRAAMSYQFGQQSHHDSPLSVHQAAKGARLPKSPDSNDNICLIMLANTLLAKF